MLFAIFFIYGKGYGCLLRVSDVALATGRFCFLTGLKEARFLLTLTLIASLLC
jgi:hypothetical protein